MVKFYLKASADLDGVTDVQPFDTPENPYEYTFIIECTRCREVHDKPITINRFESHDVTASRGEASFVYKCKGCKSEHGATITRTSDKLTPENSKDIRILEIDARGVDFNEFHPDGRFSAAGAESRAKFEEVDLEDGEWYDYDEDAGAEVSVTNVKWEITRN